MEGNGKERKEKVWKGKGRGKEKKVGKGKMESRGIDE